MLSLDRRSPVWSSLYLLLRRLVVLWTPTCHKVCSLEVSCEALNQLLRHAWTQRWVGRRLRGDVYVLLLPAATVSVWAGFSLSRRYGAVARGWVTGRGGTTHPTPSSRSDSVIAATRPVTSGLLPVCVGPKRGRLLGV